MKYSQPEVEQFLRSLSPEGPWTLTAIAVNRKSLPTVTFKGDEQVGVDKDKREWTLAEWLDVHQRDHNIHFTANPLLGLVTKKPNKGNVRAMAYIHVDVDPRDGEDVEEEQARILALLREPPEGIPTPTGIIFSGGGYQALWKLKEPIVVDGDTSKVDDAARYNTAMIAAFGGDVGTQNLERLLRLPGTINRPHERKIKRGRVPVLAQLIFWDPSHVYDIQEFQKAPEVQSDMAFGGASRKTSPNVETGNIRRLQDVDKELPEGVPDKCKVAIVQGRDEDRPIKDGDNSRSGWLFYVCCELVRNAVDDTTIYSVITDPDFKISESVYFQSDGKRRSGAGVERYALRQIERAKENAIDPALTEINDRYAFIESYGGKCRIVKETVDPITKRPMLETHMLEGFRAMYQNRKVQVPAGQDRNGNPKTREVPLGQWWLEHPLRRTYETVVFAPEMSVQGALNRWRGFACEAIAGDWSLFRRHMQENICRGSEEYFDYLLKWMAHAVQKPHLPGQVAIMFRGGQGVGKSFFAKVFGQLFGAHFRHVSSSEHLVGRFNSVLEDAVLVFADEAFYAGSSKQANLLKALITEERLFVERKGVDAREEGNCVHLIMASNEEWVIRADWDDRRMFALEVGDEHRNDREYFSTIIEQMDSGGREAMLYELMHIDLSAFDIGRVPKTEELRNQQLQTMNPQMDWWLAKLSDGRMFRHVHGWPERACQDQLQDDYLHHMRSVSSRTDHALIVQLGMFLKRVVPTLSKIRTTQTHEWIGADGRDQTSRSAIFYDMPPLSVCRSHWDETFAPHTWHDVEEHIDQNESPV